MPGIPVTAEIVIRRIQSRPGQKARPYFQNNQGKKGWKYGSSGRAPAYQVQTPELKPQYHRAKKEIIAQ
jgi:hypothetical protein